MFAASDLFPGSTCSPCLSLTVPRSRGSDGASLFMPVCGQMQLASWVPGVQQPLRLREGVPRVLVGRGVPQEGRGFS